MKSYIVTCKTSNGDLRERHIEAKDHLAAVEAAKKEGFTVVSVDRYDDAGSMAARSRKRLKRVLVSLVAGAIAGAISVACIWYRCGRHG